MISERELWACANQVLQQHDEGADEHIAARITALASACDVAGVATWHAIAERVDRLRDASGASKARH